MPTVDTPRPELISVTTTEPNRPSPLVDVNIDEPRNEPDEPTINLSDTELNNNDNNKEINITPNPIWNLNGYIPTPMGIMLSEAFDSEHTRDDDGTYFDGESPDDAI